MAQDIEAELTSSLAKQLIVIDSEIDHESVSEYISSICLEETMDDEEKVEGIREFLEEATTESIDSFMDEITSQLSLISLDRSKKVEAAKELEVIKSREAETNALKVDAIVEAVEVKVLSKEDRERREALLRQYEFVEESFEDVEGGGDADDADRNMNKQIVKDKETAVHNARKELAMMTKQKNRDDLHNQKMMAEEKEKGKKTQKQERKR